MSKVPLGAGRWVVVLVLSIATVGVPSTNQAVAGGLLYPSSFASLGQLADESGTYLIDTSAAVMTLPDGSMIQGVFDPASTAAVFTFDSVGLDNASILVSGGSPLALLSHGDMTLTGSFLQASASSGAWDFLGGQSVPGPGGYGSGGGPGAGTGSFAGGGGAGFGGTGGQGADRVSLVWPYVMPGAPGGPTYGGRSSPFQGGSGGGPGDGTPGPGGGGGGGAVELGATGNVHLSSTSILANGGVGNAASGGGSGGSIALLGNTIFFDAAQLSARGGDGGSFTFWGGPGGGHIDGGGGGGGGIIDIQGGIGRFDLQYDVSGGGGYESGDLFYGSGNPGFLMQSVPEPSGLALASIAALACLGFRSIRRRDSRDLPARERALIAPAGSDKPE
jgi:hypothetical protein